MNTSALSGQVILLTGAALGIGRALAQGLAAQGASLVLLDHRVSDLETLYDAIEQAGGPQPAIAPLNLETAGPRDYQALADKLSETFGRLDALLHNAALLGPLTPLDEYPPDTWHEVMQANVNGPFLLTQACLPLLRAAPAPRVLFTTHRAARAHDAYWGAYAVSKAAVEALASVLREENSGLRVELVDPPLVHTGLVLEAYPGKDLSTLPEPASLLPLYLRCLLPA